MRPYLGDVDAYVFSRAACAPPWADAQRVFVIRPSIDPFAPKNQEMEPDEVVPRSLPVTHASDGRPK